MADFTSKDLAAMYTQKRAEAVAELGRYNLAIFGKTGTGKSTLINAIFGQDIAQTGTGKPVTAGLEYFEHPDGILGVYDSQGFETGVAGDAVIAQLEAIIAESRNKPLEQQIHAAWYTLRWSDRRFEESQASFVRRLAELGIPVIFVLTQVPINAAGEYHADAVELANYVESMNLPLSPTNTVYLTNALPDDFHGTPVHGLNELLDATFETAPEAVQNALTAAQYIDLERKKRSATTIVKGAAASALATGATPIPFSDAAILVPLQIAMIARISAIYGVSSTTSQTATLVGSLMLASGATTAGRWLVSSLLRVVPGGQIPAMAISGTVAAGLTSAMGYAWIEVCERILTVGSIDEVDLKELFTTEFNKRLRRDTAN